MTVNVVVECQGCGMETDKVLHGGIDLRDVACPVCLGNNVVFRHFYIRDDSHILRKNKRTFISDVTFQMRTLKK